MIAFHGKRLDEMTAEELREALGAVARLPYAGMTQAQSLRLLRSATGLEQRSEGVSNGCNRDSCVKP